MRYRKCALELRSALSEKAASFGVGFGENTRGARSGAFQYPQNADDKL
jgi:hypothetical protein